MARKAANGARLAAVLGWDVPAELDRWLAMSRELEGEELIVTLRAGTEWVDALSALARDSAALWAPGDADPSRPEVLVTLLTGLVYIAEDDTVSRYYASLLPGRSKHAEVHRLHEGDFELFGSDDHTRFASLGTLLNWVCTQSGSSRRFGRSIPLSRARLPLEQDAARLARRSLWLAYAVAASDADSAALTGPRGEVMRRYFELAPGYRDWENEKPLLEKAPVLANYWLLHHHLLGNGRELSETVALARRAPGMATAGLVRELERAQREKTYGALIGGRVDFPSILAALARSWTPRAGKRR
jgi:hypothetical protein